MSNTEGARVIAFPTQDDEADEAIEVMPAQPETPTEVLGAPAEDVPMAVDPPVGRLGAADLLGIDLPARRVIVPRWLKSRADAWAVASWCLRFVGHITTYHLTRLPKYAVKALWRATVGLWRTLVAFADWVLDAQGQTMARAAMKSTDQDAWVKARKEWKETVRRRLTVTALYLVLALVALVCAWVWLPEWAIAMVLVGAFSGLVRFGAPEDAPLFDAVVTEGTQAFRLTSKMIVTALKALGISNINQALKEDPKEGIRFPRPITTDGPGFRAEIDLPHGVTAAAVMEKRSELASGLRRPLGCVWPEAAPDVHAGRLVLWVGHTELSAMKQPTAPYMRGNWKADAFGDLPFGTDQRARPIAFDLMYGNLLIGSLPGGGKTASVRGLLLALSLDPTVELRIAEHKGSGDLSMFEQMAHFYVSGVADEDIKATLGQLRSLLKEIERRAEVVKKIGKTSDLAPESKVTRQTASMRHLGLWPLVFVVDECQELFSHDEYGKEAGKLAERVIKRGRAFGVISIWATQRPDRASLPTGVSANVSHRFCLRVTGQVENDMVLGTSAYKNGIQATTLSQRDKGIGYLKGAFDDAVVVRSYYCDKPAAERVAARALALRQAAGTITGQAAGDEVGEPTWSLVDDLQTIFVSSERLHSEDIVERLQALRPSAYQGWDATAFALALKGAVGVRTRQMEIEGRNRYGVRRDDLLEALADRELASAEPEDGD